MIRERMLFDDGAVDKAIRKAVDDLLDRFHADKERLAKSMLEQGLTPETGWGIGECWDCYGLGIKYSLAPVHVRPYKLDKSWTPRSSSVPTPPRLSMCNAWDCPG